MIEAKRFSTWWFGFAVLLTACGGESGDVTEPTVPTQLTVARVTITQTVDTVTAIGGFAMLRAAAIAAGGETVPGVRFTWSTSDSTIATVSSTGVVTAIANGDVQVSATTGGVVGTTNLTVRQVAAQLAFASQPTDTEPGLPFAPSVEVEIHDSRGTVVPFANDDITISLTTNGLGGSLTGTRTVGAVDGIAEFTGLAVNGASLEYTLSASAAGLQSDTSDEFGVFLRFASLSTGRAHTCGITTTAVTYCWGLSDSGQIGDGTGGVNRARPTLVQGTHSFRSVTAGWFHTCGLTNDGSAYCWGANDRGELGDGAKGTSSNVPVPVSGAYQFLEVQAGFSQTCGLTSDRDLYCWGASTDAPGVDSDIPTLIAARTDLESLSSFTWSVCGVTSAGAGYCNAGGNTVPASVPGGISFSSINPGNAHYCAVSSDGTGYCWGDNDFGQLGDGQTGTNATTPVAVDADIDFTEIDAGSLHSCGLSATGASYCWGYGRNGEMGINNAVNRDVPTATAGTMLYVAISVGGSHNCAISTEGAAFCWGGDFEGQLGNGEPFSSMSAPVLVIEP